MKHKGKAPSFPFYPNDWLRDLEEFPSVEGPWIRAICKMWWEPERGKMTRTIEQWALIFRTNVTISAQICAHLSQWKIADVTRKGDQITLINRRMYRAYLKQVKDRARQKKHRCHKIVTPPVTPLKSLPSSSSSSPSGEELSKDNSIRPRRFADAHLRLAKLLEKEIRGRMPRHRIGPKDAERWAVDIRLMEEIDQVGLVEIEGVIEWLWRDGFWYRNILSGAKLRKQFGRLCEEMRPPRKGESPYVGASRRPLSEAEAKAKRELERATADEAERLKAEQDSAREAAIAAKDKARIAALDDEFETRLQEFRLSYQPRA